MMKDQCLQLSLASEDDITCQLERMLANPDFDATPQQTAFLKYVVNQTLAGNADRIKGYTVATEVFGRRSDFDQSIDPIVSIQASRLRQALAQYFETAGRNDPIRIDIPKGTYVPVFSQKPSSIHPPDDQTIAAEQAAPLDVMEAWPTIQLRPLTNLTANPDDDYLVIGLTAELAHALSHYREIRILEAFRDDQKPTAREIDYDFIIGGSIRRDSAGLKVSISLHDSRKGMQIWSGTYRGDFEAAKMISFEENVAAEIAVRIAGGNAEIPRHLSGLSRNKPMPELTTYEAMLRYWEYDTLRTRRSYVRAIKALEHAVTQEPDYGQTWSMLASLYVDNYGLEMVDLPTPLEKAAAFAQKGISLDPTNRSARAIMAYVRFMENKLSEARYEAETAYNLCPNSLMVLDTLGWVMALAGGWEQGVDWIKRAIKLNSYYRPWVRNALCVNRLREGNYQKAYRESFQFRMLEFYWDPLLKATACGHLGRIEKGQACVKVLLALKPDFAKQGRILIGRYVKFQNIVDRIIEGLGKLGMTIES
jgi:adenylate cyclase